MKKRSKVEIILIDILSVLIITSALYYLKDDRVKPEDFIKDKYRSNCEYRVVQQEKKDNYLAYLGRDNENIYVDIFDDDKFLVKRKFYLRIIKKLIYIKLLNT
ncbi:MAG TPA: hypothetical protein DCE48_04600 [Lachnospiraceae bacterium]|uniref:hypothetical protein n=1 Tax=Anaerosporobacter sp. TaxID=1872529 RepID=UPI000EE8390E|nr:hypothetical protein [Anaerosporobacter sp.]HAB59980.1 hypothetical protein [Lachnospiraceae bacterium]